MRTLVIEVHSLGKKQINKEEMPFLSSLIDRFGLGSVKPCFGYDIQTCFWTGLDPENSGNFAKYEYDRDKDRFSFLNLLPYKLGVAAYNLFKFLRGDDFFTTLCRHKHAKHFQIQRINHFFSKKFGIKTMFDYLREGKKSFLFYQWPVIATDKGHKVRLFPRLDDKKSADKFVKLSTRSYDLNYINLRELDIVSHKYGPFSEQAKDKLREIDGILRGIVQNFDLEKDNIMILSFFSQIPVRNYYDIEGKLPLFGKDYVYFLDSTQARFWFFNDEKRKEVLGLLNENDGGHWVSEGELKKYHCDFKDSFNKNFDELFLMDFGNVISPCFFHKNRIKGCHSWGLKEPDEYGIYVFSRKSKKTDKKCDLVDIMPSLLRVMDISYTSLDGHFIFTE